MTRSEREVDNTIGSAVSKAAPPLGEDAEEIQDIGELPAVLTVEETARFLRISRASAYRAVRRGELPAIRIGKMLRVPRDRLLQWVDQGQAPITRRRSA